MTQAFKKQNPHASELTFHPGAKPMTQPIAPLGSSYKVPVGTKFSPSMLPEEIWGVTAMFKLDPNFSEFDLRRNPDLASGNTMHLISDALGSGPSFETNDGKSDVMHVDCLPHRQGHDTANWKPYLGEGNMKIVQPSGIITESYLVVDVPHLNGAKRAYENTFGGARQKVTVAKVASHFLNNVMEQTAIRNAQKIAHEFSVATGVKLSNYDPDVFSCIPNAELPRPCALSVDNPFDALDSKQITISSGMRVTSNVNPKPLVVSPSKLHTILSQVKTPYSVRVPAYFSISKNKSVVNQAHHTFHRERVFYPEKQANVSNAFINQLLPDLEERKYNETFGKACPYEVDQLHSVAVFTL
jgi:hypothetical protein